MAIRRVSGSRKPVAGKKEFGRIGVLMGGPSSEREISLKSGKAVYEALTQLRLDAVCVDIKTDRKNENLRLLDSHKIDCAFLALHGRFGEDGQMQKILENLKIPYTGSGVRASKLAMDKIASRRIFESARVCVPAYKVIKRKQLKAFLTRKAGSLTYPLVIKPAAHGSSIGLSIIDKPQGLEDALQEAFRFDERAVIEEYIKGRELTVGILNDRALPVIEVIPKNEFFDFEAKYQPGLTEYVVPAKLKESLAQRVKKAALLCHKLLGCSGCSRVDIILSCDDKPFVLEVNTIPGLTNTSLLPKAAGITGIDFTNLCLTLIKLAYEKK